MHLKNKTRILIPQTKIIPQSLQYFGKIFQIVSKCYRRDYSLKKIILLANYKIFLVRSTADSVSLAKILSAEKCKQQAKMHQKKNSVRYLYKNFFEQFWKVDQKTKIVHFFNNSKQFFFSKQISQRLW